jgi:hypothetical protein
MRAMKAGLKVKEIKEEYHWNTEASEAKAAAVFGHEVKAENVWQVAVVPAEADPATHSILHFYVFPGDCSEAKMLAFASSFKADGLRAHVRRITYFKHPAAPFTMGTNMFPVR